MSKIPEFLEGLIFKGRIPLLVLFAVFTVIMGYSATQLKVDAGFAKLLPLKHEYMQTFVKHQEEFGGANRVIVALMQKEGDIFTKDYFTALREATDEVFFLPGTDRTRVTSIYSPKILYIEIIEDGFAGGPVVPADFQPTPEYLSLVKKNISKSGQLGRLVTPDYKGAMITAELMDTDPTSGEKLDYQKVARQLEGIRTMIEDKYPGIDVHIIGFAKSTGDIADGARGVVSFFAVALVITALMLYFYSGSVWLTVWPLLCSIVAVIWQLGLLNALGFGMDPMTILVPFLVFAIGVSHGVQMINGWNGEVLFGDTTGGEIVEHLTADMKGVDSETAARRTFRSLLAPGSIALISDTIGFMTVLLIEIGIIQEMATTASLGVGLILITNLVLMPILLSYTRIGNIDKYRGKHANAVEKRDWIWRTLATFSNKVPAMITIVVALCLLVWGLWQGQDMKIGDLTKGVPELREESVYNQDSAVITDSFTLGVDTLTVIAETKKDACIDYSIMKHIEQYSWFAQNLDGVQAVNSLPVMAKANFSGQNEQSLKWMFLPNNTQVLILITNLIETVTGLLNNDCSYMPVYLFTTDHKATTISHIISELKRYNKENPHPEITYELATGNVGVMAATNEAVEAAQIPMLVYVYAAIIFLCLMTFRSIRATICIVLPLALVSILCYAVMAIFDIGLKVNTLPVVALGAGIGVDYGIYIYSKFDHFMKQGNSIHDSFYDALKMTGKPVIFTAFTLGVGVFTWLFSALKFQADMGILLTFMFLVNMLGAIFLLPALARILLKDNEEA